MWTKRYILYPTKEEFFKTKHPIATSSVLVPMILYVLFIRFSDVDSHNWWILVGWFGSMIAGIGIAYAFAVKRKIYEKVWCPVLHLLCGVTLLAVSLFFLL